MKAMNQTEKKAYDWLVRNGYTDISFSSRTTPDFTTGNGEGFEVKKSRENTIFFGPLQVESILHAPSSTVIVFDGGDEPIARIPATDLAGKPRLWRNIRIHYGNNLGLSPAQHPRRQNSGLAANFPPVGNYIGTVEAAKRLGISRTYLGELLWRRKIKGTFVRNTWYIDSDSVDCFHKEHPN